jgi:hypothetical protein
MSNARALVVCFALAASILGCPHSHSESSASMTVAALPAHRPIAERIYDGALESGWEDSGWSPHDLGHGPASVDFSNEGGWMIAKPTLTGNYGGLVFRVKAPPTEAEFLEVRLDSRDKNIFPRVMVRADQKADVGDGWSEVFINIAELDPDGAPFDRVVFRAFRDVPNTRVMLDGIALVAAGDDGGAPAPSPIPSASATLRVDCRATATAISPLIYGIAWDARAKGPPQVRATTRRWGGNPASRFNWQLGNAWNTASDWFFENVETKPVAEFFSDDAARGWKSALTVPTIGWVAKDTTSYSFPVSAFGAQQRTDEYKSDAGNGNKPDGSPITSTSPERTSVRAPPEFVARWIDALAKSKTLPDIVILDNEPGLWNETHRDVHPEPTTYDELLDRTVRYAAAIRAVAPNVKIAGPAEWGWSGYMYSAKDKKEGFRLAPDRRAHGDVPLVPWLLASVKKEEAKRGTKLLDLLDLHFYPQGKGVYSNAADPKTAALRINQVRGLWDPRYVDESWIGEPIRLLPRMHEWIDQNDPGLGLMIGEWSFGGEQHMSGGLATAEALGRFGQYGVTAAYYWTVPPAGSPTATAFHAYDDFEKFSVPTNATPQTSLFASRDKAGKHVVLVALNFSPDAAIAADVDSSSCGDDASASAKTYQGRGDAFAPARVSTASGHVKLTLPAYSITVVDLHLASPITTAVRD